MWTKGRKTLENEKKSDTFPFPKKMLGPPKMFGHLGGKTQTSNS